MSSTHRGFETSHVRIPTMTIVEDYMRVKKRSRMARFALIISIKNIIFCICDKNFLNDIYFHESIYQLS